eukprot:6844419-Pyramimonas_sp.AAC.1
MWIFKGRGQGPGVTENTYQVPAEWQMKNKEVDQRRGGHERRERGWGKQRKETIQQHHGH